MSSARDESAKRQGNSLIQFIQFDILGEDAQALQDPVGALENSTVLVYAEMLINPFTKTVQYFLEGFEVPFLVAYPNHGVSRT